MTSWYSIRAARLSLGMAITRYCSFGPGSRRIFHGMNAFFMLLWAAPLLRIVVVCSSKAARQQVEQRFVCSARIAVAGGIIVFLGECVISRLSSFDLTPNFSSSLPC
jgi:hypothetical protein